MSGARSTTERPLLRVEGVSKTFTLRDTTGRFFAKQKKGRAVDRVSFTVKKGETFGIVGESGSGKSTLLQCLALITIPDEGRISLDGRVLFENGKVVKRPKGRIEMVFQDPSSSLNPTLKIKDIVGEPLLGLKIAGEDRETRIMHSLETVGLENFFAEKYPSQISGGQKQRVAVARALVTNPSLILLDEPTSALDVGTQAQVINLLNELQRKLKLTYIFVTHNLTVARYLSDRLAVFYAGSIRELGSVDDVTKKPLDPYTVSLSESTLLPTPGTRGALDDIDVTGEPPSFLNPPAGCAFHPRCPYVKDVCRSDVPRLKEILDEHYSMCHFAREIFLKK